MPCEKAIRDAAAAPSPRSPWRGPRSPPGHALSPVRGAAAGKGEMAAAEDAQRLILALEKLADHTLSDAERRRRMYDASQILVKGDAAALLAAVPKGLRGMSSVSSLDTIVAATTSTTRDAVNNALDKLPAAPPPPPPAAPSGALHPAAKGGARTAAAGGAAAPAASALFGAPGAGGCGRWTRRQLEEAAGRLVALADERVRASTAAAVLSLPAMKQSALGVLRGAVEERTSPAQLERVLICGDLDGYLLDVLEQHSWDPKEALAGTLAHLEWRAARSVDRVLSAPSVPMWKASAHRRFWPGGFHKYDRLQQPIYVDRSGLLRLPAMLEELHFTQADLNEIYVSDLEMKRNYVLPQLSRRLGRRVGKCTVLLDLTGLNASFLCSDVITYVKRVSEVFEGNYEELQHTIVVANAPRIFQRVWGIISRVFSERSLSKVRVLDSRRPPAAQLADLVDEGSIPTFIGGSSPCAIGQEDASGDYITDIESKTVEIDRARIWIRQGKRPEIEEAILDGSAAALLEREAASSPPPVPSPPPPLMSTAALHDPTGVAAPVAVGEFSWKGAAAAAPVAAEREAKAEEGTGGTPRGRAAPAAAWPAAALEEPGAGTGVDKPLAGWERLLEVMIGFFVLYGMAASCVLVAGRVRDVLEML